MRGNLGDTGGLGRLHPARLHPEPADRRGGAQQSETRVRGDGQARAGDVGRNVERESTNHPQNHPRGAGIPRAHTEAQPSAARKSSSAFGQGTRRLTLQRLPILRGAMKGARPVILEVDTSAEHMEFVNSNAAAELSQVGAACPDHLVHTKRVPLYLDWTRSRDWTP